mgnify:CR=1 FL=1
MALTTEQQAQVDIQLAVENARNANQAALDAKRTKMDAVRLAKETLIENARSKPVDARDITAADITAFAQALIAYVDA